MRLSGKVAIVTGSSRGIGLSIATSFAKEGAKVIICSRKKRQYRTGGRDPQRNISKSDFSICSQHESY